MLKMGNMNPERRMEGMIVATSAAIIAERAIVRMIGLFPV